MFDATGKVIDRDALRSLSFKAFPAKSRVVAIDRERDTKTSTIIDEDTGTVMGASTFHGSGRVDAEVRPKAAGVGTGTR